MPAVKICEISKDKIGQKITAYAVVKEKFRKLTINQPQKEYLEVHITDGTAGAVLKIWEPNDLLDKLCSSKNMIYFMATVAEFNGRIHLNLVNENGKNYIRRVKENELDTTCLADNPPSHVSVELLKKEFDAFGDCLERHRKQLWDKIFSSEVKTMFYKQYGSIKAHHTYAGGLARHSMETMEAAEMLCRQNNLGERMQLVKFCACLHDIGKIYYYSLPPLVEITIDGRLFGHEYLGARIVENALKSVPEYPSHEAAIILHTILSHDQNGDVLRPMTIEASIVSEANKSSSRVEGVKDFIDKDVSENSLTNFDAFRSQYFLRI